ncbi:cold-shock protein [Sphingomonas molluscorum]|uniref:cold-shock protein n=1 Tax=Sphingomonas molluscorum TaxID=418184 RepID=UPI0031D6F338
MPTGTVKFVEPGGRYGFISRDDKQPKVFVHIDAVLEAGYTELRKHQRWSFELVEGRNGRIKAGDLTLLPD